MSKRIIRNPISSFLICLSVAIFFFAGCSESLPELRAVDYSLIFEYENETSLPKARLSVFVETLSEVRRADELLLVSDETDYSWVTDDVIMLENSRKKWAGHTNFVLPPPEKIPTGRYTVTYIDAAGEEVETGVNISYDKKLYSLKANQVDDYMSKHGNLKKIAVYDELNTLIYYGEETYELNSNSKIKAQYRSAAYKNTIWCRYDNTVICILPKENLK